MFAKSLCKALESAVHAEIEFVEPTSFPQQVNCHDCGMYALAVAALLPYSSEYASTKGMMRHTDARLMCHQALPACLSEKNTKDSADHLVRKRMEDMIAMVCISDFRSRLMSLILSKCGHQSSLF
jgi:hypothetical protein